MNGNATDDRPVRVLVVDDDEDVRVALRNVLTMYGWSVTATAGPAQALTAVRAPGEPFRLMIVDLVLDDELGGLALTDILHRLEPEARFLFISGKVDRGIPRDTLPGVPKAFLAKPMSVRELIETARGLLD